MPTPTPAPAPSLETQAVMKKLEILTAFDELIAQPVPEPELSAFKLQRDSMKQALLLEMGTLIDTPAHAADFDSDISDFELAIIGGTLIEKLIGGSAGRGAGA